MRILKIVAIKEGYISNFTGSLHSIAPAPRNFNTIADLYFRVDLFNYYTVYSTSPLGNSSKAQESS